MGVTVLSVVDDTPSFINEQGMPVSINGNNYKSLSPAANAIQHQLRNQIALYTGMRYAATSDVFLTMPWIAFQNRVVLGLGSLCSETNMSVVTTLPELKDEDKGIIDIDGTAVVEADFSLPYYK